MADVDAGTPVTPESRFRIASVSKPITAVAVLQLVEQGKLRLDDRVLDRLGMTPKSHPNGEASRADENSRDDAFDSSATDPRWRDVTLLHLLQHRGGWDHDVSFDPMFRSVEFAQKFGLKPPADASTVIRAMLTRPLDFDPGHRYAYSNFGYCLLGRIIEQASGMRYEEYVKTRVLDPVGAGGMRLGRTRLGDRAETEVRYYHPGTRPSVFAEDVGKPVPAPYGGWNLEAMDAHGGWIATASELARFAAAFDNPQDCPILSADSIRVMYRRPETPAPHGPDLPNQTDKSRERNPSREQDPSKGPASGASASAPPDDRPVYYSCGWSNRDVGDGRFNRWHNGSLPGTLAILIRRHDGINMVGLVNTRTSPNTDRLAAALDRMLHQATRFLRP